MFLKTWLTLTILPVKGWDMKPTELADFIESKRDYLRKNYEQWEHEGFCSGNLKQGGVFHRMFEENMKRKPKDAV